MKYSNLPPSTISKLVRGKLIESDYTLKRCCNSFNYKYSIEIDDRKLPLLNKDFLSRITRGKFKVVNLRVSKICEFLEISEQIENTYQEVFFNKLSEQITILEEHVVKCNLTQQFDVLLPFLRRAK